MIWGRTYYSQWKQFNIGEEAFKKIDLRSAISGYDSAIHMYTPGSGMVKRSIDRLWQIGEMFEKRLGTVGLPLPEKLPLFHKELLHPLPGMD